MSICVDGHILFCSLLQEGDFQWGLAVAGLMAAAVAPWLTEGAGPGDSLTHNVVPFS